MKTFIFISCLFITSSVSAQSTAGITGIADTGYNVPSEYRKNIKNYPGISIAQEINSAEIRAEKNITYCSYGNRKLVLDVFQPANQSKTKNKAIIIIHGGGWRGGNRTLHYALAQKLALMGYVCITPEYRLSTEALYPAAVHDLKAAIRWVRKNASSYNIDTNSIVVSGHSAGGQLAAFMGATNGKAEFEGGVCNPGVSATANAVVDMDGILAFIHPESGEGDDSKRTSAASYWFGYSKAENAELWKQGSPLTHVGEHSASVLFMNSSVDRMHAGQKDYIGVLDKHNIYSDVKTFKGAPHSFLLFHPWFDTTVAYIDDFIRTVLPDAKEPYVSKVWVADKGDGSYKNPVINADYSDPDAVRVGDDYYMVASSFSNIPAIPILHSKDLVNWKLIGHALQKLPPYEYFSKVRHGDGVWAPSIRFQKGEFYIYYPEPELGIYLTKSKNINGPWSEPVLVEGGKGLIDPCPFWDESGKLYLVHAYAGSRAGIKSILVVKEMNAEGSSTINEGVVVYDGHNDDPTIEGPKIYKRNVYYYIFAPAGGVSTGWQTILRSKNIYGPYERKVVLDGGKTNVNGPHQGAWVDTRSGEDWFVHFQDREAYGRVVHLQPMVWVNDWPVIGNDKDGDGKGEPVLVHKKPSINGKHPIQTPAESDEFNDKRLGLQWQWQANAKLHWAYPNNGSLRMFAVAMPDSINNYWMVPNLLMQKFPAEEFVATTKIRFNPRLDGERAGLIISGQDYAYISVVKKAEGIYVSHSNCKKASDKNVAETVVDLEKLNGTEIYLRVRVTKGGVCEFNYSVDGKVYKPISEKHVAKPGRWIGAKVGLFCTGISKTNDPGYADVDWFRVESISETGKQ